MPSNTVLKRKHTLIGTNILELVKKVKAHNAREKVNLARIRSNLPLEGMTSEDMCSKFRELTNESEKEILEMAGKDLSINNLRLLLHYCILMANETGKPDGQQLQAESSDEEIQEPPAKKRIKKDKKGDQSQELEDLKQKVRLLATQNKPSEALILLTLDELAKKARVIGSDDADTFDELARQAARNQGKVNIVTLALSVLGGKASDVVSKALSKCLKESDEKSKENTSSINKPDMTSPLINAYPPVNQQSYMQPPFMPYVHMPYQFGYQGYRPRYPRRPSASATRPIGPCLFCEEMGHLVKDCLKLKALKQK